MAQVGFAYDGLNDPAARSVSVSVFADRPHMRGKLREDAAAAGLVVAGTGSIASLLEGASRPLGDIVILDCPRVEAAEIAALSQLDMRAARSGTHLIVSTSMDGLDAVFACLDQSGPQILVDPSRGERVIALGRALASFANLRLRELSEEDRLMLLRLTEQVDRIAERLEGLEGAPGVALRSLNQGSIRGDDTFRVEAPPTPFLGMEDFAEGPRAGMGRFPLPEGKYLRAIIRQRQLRNRFFDPGLFADPAWDILLDLTAAHVEQVRVSVTSLCIAAAVPPTTALRWIAQMTQAGLLQRQEDEADRRRAFITLSEKALNAMARYFAQLEHDRARTG